MLKGVCAKGTPARIKKEIPLARVREGVLPCAAYVCLRTQLLGEEKPEESAQGNSLWLPMRRCRRYMTF